MFKKGDRWRHVNSLDIDIIVTNVSYVGPEYVKLKVLYLNRNYNSIIFPKAETVQIKREDFPKWELIGD